jgi:4-hydroxybenzoate polyprenyltransferase
LVCLLLLVSDFGLNWLSLAGVGAVGLLLLWEHSLVRADDLSRVNAAFFTANGWISMLFFGFWSADILLLRAAL